MIFTEDGALTDLGLIVLVALFLSIPVALSVLSGLLTGMLTRRVMFGLGLGLGLGLLGSFFGLLGWLVFWPVLTNYREMMLPAVAAGLLCAAGTVVLTLRRGRS